jgi:hypothetical protein
VAEPIASKEPIDVLKQLKRDTLKFCGDWYEWRWRDRNWLDARPEMEAWTQVNEFEAKATSVRRHAQDALTELLKFVDSYEKGTGGLISEGLALAARPSRVVLRRMHDGIVINLPIVEPSRTQLLRRIATMYVIPDGYRVIEIVNQGPKPVPSRFRRDDLEYAKKFIDIKPRELAVYTLLAGFWPTSIKVAENPERGARKALLLGNGKGVSVSQVLTEEQKYVRKARELMKAHLRI